jgi:type VI secretion system protein VasG
MQLDMKTLVGKLNPACKKALEQAAQLCVQQTNFNVEVEHLLLKLLEQTDTDLAVGLKAFEVDVSALTADLQGAVEGIRRGNTRTPALSPQIADLLQEAWILSSLKLGQNATRSAGVLQAALDTASIRDALVHAAPALGAIPRDGLREAWPDILKQSPEAMIDPIVGRDPRSVRSSTSSCGAARTTRSSPARPASARRRSSRVSRFRIAEATCRRRSSNVALRALDLGLLQAGAGMKGEFENRLKSVIEEVKASPKPIILFIDEAHTLIGAGGGRHRATRRTC